MVSIGAVTGVLQDINVDEATIQAIVDILELGIDVLETPLQPVDESVFGSSHAGGELGYHTGRAHAKVAAAMNDMLLGLGHYRDGIRKYAAETLEVDDNVAVAATRLQAELDAAAACLAQPDVRDNPVCAPTPAPEED